MNHYKVSYSSPLGVTTAFNVSAKSLIEATLRVLASMNALEDFDASTLTITLTQ